MDVALFLRVIRISRLLVLLTLTGCGPAQDHLELVGKALPPIVLETIDGQIRQEINRANVPMLVNVWATWCAPCRAEMASLNSIYGDYGQRGLAVLGISIDQDRYLVSEYLRTGAVNFPVLLDTSGTQIRHVLRTPAVPVTILIDRHGKVRRLVIGERDWNSPECRQWIEALIAA